MNDRAETSTTGRTPVTIIVAASGPFERWLPCLHALRVALPTERIVLCGSGGPGLEGLAAHFGAETSPKSFAASLAELRDWPDRPAGAGEAFPCHVLAVTAPVLVPSGVLDRAREHLDRDLRTATVSFLSNSAGILSIPARNAASYHQLSSHDEQSVTNTLRSEHPDTGVASIPHPAGAIHLVSRHALSACDGPRHDLELSPNGLLTELALRAQRRGFVCAVDTGTFVLSVRDLGATNEDPFDDPDDRRVLLDEHPFAAAGNADARTRDDSPTGLVVHCAIVKIAGLDITIDGRCLGDQEMGTQVQTLALARALSARSDVRQLTIATNGPIPGVRNRRLRRPERAPRAHPRSRLRSCASPRHPASPVPTRRAAADSGLARQRSSHPGDAAGPDRLRGRGVRGGRGGMGRLPPRGPPRRRTGRRCRRHLSTTHETNWPSNDSTSAPTVCSSCPTAPTTSGGAR